MKKIALYLILTLVLSTSVYSQTADEIDAAYQDIVQRISQGEIDVDAENVEEIRSDEERIQEVFQEWIADQPIPDTDGELLEDGTCGPCLPEVGQDPQFEQPGAITIKGKKNENGHYPTSFKVTWKKPKPLNGNSSYELSHYNVYLAQGDNSFEIFKVVSENKNSNGNIKNSIRFKNKAVADYAISVQAVYQQKPNKSLGFGIKAISSTSPYSDLTYLTTYASTTTVDSLTGGVRECVVDKSGYQPTQLLSEITNVRCYYNTLKNSDLEAMGTFVNLSYLYLYDNKIVTDISPLLNLPSLSGLYLYKNSQVDTTVLSGFTGLTSLSLQSMGLTQMPDVSGSPSLYNLQLANNQITDFGILNSSTSLRYLYLSGNNITQVPNLSGLTILYNLSLGSNQLTSGFENLNSLTSLRYLYLNSNNLTQIPVLSGLTSLYNLNLSNNQITTGFENLNAHTGLGYLYLDGNSLSQVPDLSSLTSLYYLSLGSNQLEANDFSTLPNTIGNLNLYNNLITDCSGLEGRDIASLTLGGNNLTSIDYCSDINNLTSLRVYSANNLNTTQNIDSFAGLYTLQFYNTNIEHLTGSRPTSNLYLYYNRQLKSFDLVKPAQNTAENSFPNLVPSVVYLQGNTNMYCSSVYDAKATQDAYPTTDFRSPITTTVDGVTKTTQAITGYNANKTFYPPSTCIPDSITDFSAVKDPASYKYLLNWSKQDHDLWGVTNYEVRINGVEERSVPYEFELPLTVNIIGASLASFEVRVCAPSSTSTQSNPQTTCSDWYTSPTTLGLGKINNLQYSWVNQDSGRFNLSFDYPQELTTVDTSTPDFFLVSPGALQVTDETIPSVTFNQGSGSFQTSTIDLDSFFSYQYSIRACKNTDTGTPTCGQGVRVSIDNTRLLELSPPTLKSFNGLTLTGNGFTSTTGNFEISFAKSADNANVDIDYFKIKENQPTPIIDGPPINIPAFDPINGLDNISTFTVDALDDDSASIDLIRKSNGNYTYEITACIRDFEEGDQCSQNPMIKPVEVSRTINNHADLSHMPVPVGSVAGEEDPNFKNVYLSRLGCVTDNSSPDYDGTGCTTNQLNTSALVQYYGGYYSVYYSAQTYFNKKQIRWSYNETANSTKPDYFYFTKLNLAIDGKNANMGSSAVTYANSYNNDYNNLRKNSCLTKSADLTGINTGNFQAGNYYAKQKFVQRSTGKGTYWTTSQACKNQMRVGSDGLWKIQACYDGIGCTNGKTIDIAQDNGYKSAVIAQKSSTTEKEIIATKSDLGPSNLSPGLWWNPHQSGTGWYFYWKNNSKYPTTDLHHGYDLLAYWVTYRSINGLWSPVWMKATLKLSQEDGKGNQYFEGPLKYSSFDAGGLDEQNVGNLRVLINSGSSNKAQIELFVAENSGLMTNYNDIDMDFSGANDEYKITHDDFDNDPGEIVSYLKIPLEIASLRLVNESNTARFGQKHHGTHFQGAWRYSAEIDQQTGKPKKSPKDVELLIWKLRNLELNTFFIFDDGDYDADLGKTVQHPVWFQSQSPTCSSPANCSSSNDNPRDDYYASSFYSVINGFNPLGYADPNNPVNVIQNVATGGRIFTDKYSQVPLSQFEKYKQGKFRFSISQASIETDAQGQARRPVNMTIGGTGGTNQMVVMDKIANIHHIGFNIQDANGDIIYKTDAGGNSVLETQCDPNEIGDCTISFSWYSDSGDKTIRPFYKKDGVGDFAYLSNICSGVPTNEYLVSSYTCSNFSQGTYEFELRTSYSGAWIPIAESEDLVVLGCTDENACVIVEDYIPYFAAAPDPAPHTLSQNASSSKVGFTSGALNVDMSGAASYSVPIFTPAGTGGMKPGLSLVYSSNDVNNNIAGVGWSIGGISSISRCLKNVEQDGIALEDHKPITLTSDDAFCLDGQKLKQVPNSITNGIDGAEYRTELENFSKITVVNTQDGGPETFEVRLKNGEIREYGSSSTSHNAQIKADDTNKVITWLLNKITDRHGNEIWYVWDNDNTSGETYLDKVQYTRRGSDNVYQNSIQFNYEDRNDKGISYSLFRQQKRTKRLSSVRTLRKKLRTSVFETIRELKLDYDYSPLSKNSIVNSITSCANISSSSCLKPVVFDWNSLSTDKGFSDKQSSQQIMAFNKVNLYKTIDLNGDGRKEIISPRESIHNSTNPEIRFYTFGNSDYIALQDNNSGGCGTTEWDPVGNRYKGYFNKECNLDIQPTEPEKHNITNSDYFIYDFNGDGKEDLLSPVKVQGQNLSYWTVSYSNGNKLCQDSNSGLGCLDQYNSNIEWRGGANGGVFLDFTADGLPDLLAFDAVDLGDEYDTLFFNEFFTDYNSVSPGLMNISHLNSINSSTIFSETLNSKEVTIDKSGTEFNIGDIYCLDNGLGANPPYIPCEDVRDNEVDLDLNSIVEISSISSVANDFDGDGLSDVLISYRYLFHWAACYGGVGKQTNSKGGTTIASYEIRDSGCWVKFWAIHTYDPTGENTAQLKHLKTIGMSRGPAMNEAFLSIDNGGSIQIYDNPNLDLGTEENIQVMDFNGDGLADIVINGDGKSDNALNHGVLINNGDGFNGIINFNRFDDGDYDFANISGYSESEKEKDFEYLTQFYDYDYDGDMDILYPEPESSDAYVRYRYRALEYSETQGYYFSNKIDTQAVARNKDAAAGEVLHIIEDFNGDSFPDHLYVKKDAGNGDEKFTEFANNAWKAREKITKITKTANNGIIDETTISYESANLPTVYARTFDGFGQDWGAGSAVFDVSAPNMYLVREVSTLSPTKTDANNTASIYYHYKGLKVQGGGRGSLGFSEMSTVDVQNNVSTQSTYRQDFPYTGSPETTLKYHHATLNNIAANDFSCAVGTAVCAYNECSGTSCMDPIVSGTAFDPLTDGINQYDEVSPASNAGTYFIYMEKSIEDHYELGSSNILKTTITTMDYENKATPASFYGNVSNNSSKVCSDYTDGVCTVVTSTSVSNVYDSSVDNIDKWILGRLTSSTSSQSRLDTDPVSATFEGLLTINNSSSFTYNAPTGQLETEISGTGDGQYIKAKHIHDIYGNETHTLACSKSVVDDGNCDKDYRPSVVAADQFNIFRYSESVYDTVWHLYTDKSKSLFGTQGTASTLVTTSEVISRDVFGNVTQAKDLLNNITADTQYGLFGEAQASKSAIGSYSQSLNSWCTSTTCPTNAIMFTETQSAGSPTSREYKDAQGRVVRVQTQSMGTISDPGTWTTVDSWYDQSGRAKYTTVPYVYSANPDLYLSTNTYDDLGRVTATSTQNHAGLATTSTTYNGLTITGFNAKNQKKVSKYDVSGKVVEIKQYLTNLNTVYSSIKYHYGANDKLVKMNSNGSSTVMTYDNLGRKLTMSDPDKGDWSYAYSPTGDMLDQTDGLGQIIDFTYDVQGRQIAKKGSMLIGEQEIDAKWYFDESGNYGKLTHEVGITHSPTTTDNWTEKTEKYFTYDNFGRASSVATRIWDGDNANNFSRYTGSTTYDQYSRIFQSIDATGFGTMYLYDAYGYQYKTLEAASCEDQLSSSCEVYTDSDSVAIAYRVYYEAVNMDQFGNITKDQFHDGALTTIRNYNQKDGIMENTCIDASPTDDCSADEQDKLVFGFDKLGNLISKSDKIGTEIFTYDELNRLDTETRIIGASNQTLGYGYSTNGNLTSKGGDILSYNGSRPHAVTSFDGTSFEYDANGNMTTSTSGNFQRTIDYSGLSKAYYIHNANNNKGSYFVYDANHNRQVRKDSQNNMRTKTTHYIGNVEMIKSADDNIETYKRYIGPLIIDMPSIDASQLSWKYNYQLKDHLGSSHSIITLRSNGVETESLTLSFDAWGKRRWVDSFAVSDINAGDAQFSGVIDKTTRGYTGHEHLDEVGIIHMNGRIYAPHMGRFLQADPIIQDPFGTQSLNRYTYVGNNPLSLNDPTGYWSVDAFMQSGGTQLVAIGFTLVGMPPWLAGAFSGAINGGGLKGMVVGAITASLYHQIGGFYGDVVSDNVVGGITDTVLKTGLTAGQFAGKVALHGLVGGASSVVMGGKFGHGFTSAGVTQAASPAIDLIKPGASGTWLRVAAAAIVGGTASHLTGGKFANGAVTGAFSRAFNDEHAIRRAFKRLRGIALVASSKIQINGMLKSNRIKVFSLLVDMASTDVGYKMLNSAQVAQGGVINIVHGEGKSNSIVNSSGEFTINLSLNEGFVAGVSGSKMGMIPLQVLAHEFGHVVRMPGSSMEKDGGSFHQSYHDGIINDFENPVIKELLPNRELRGKFGANYE